MRIKSLSLKNIGPFIEADMEFLEDSEEKPPVVLITGENGTGKSIILDAIRGMFGGAFCELEREIQREPVKKHSEIKMKIGWDQKDINNEMMLNFVADSKKALAYMKSGTKNVSVDFFLNFPATIEGKQIMPSFPLYIKDSVADCPNWIVDFWPSTSASGSYKIETLKAPNHREFLIGALQGERKKSDITQLICHFDYVRDSRDPEEKATGERLYEILEKIVEKSLLDGGKLSHVSRSTYEPVVIQNGQAVALENLSSGNSYLIQNLVSLLSKMYSVHFLRKTPLDELCKAPGLLLIDEAENQLHPKWQKRFIPTILEIFPNLQIIATTHSPFIISSVPNAKLFVCKSRTDHCIVEDETAQYSNKPMDEILMSPLFEETQPFNEEISGLIKARKKAVESGDTDSRNKIEAKLKALNPQYFSYFDIDKLLEELNNEESNQ